MEIKITCDTASMMPLNDLEAFQGKLKTITETEFAKLNLIAFECNLIYEPFSGSGTTIIAAQQTGRKCYAMEISPQYVQVALERWSNFTGEDPIRESDEATFSSLKHNKD